MPTPGGVVGQAFEMLNLRKTPSAPADFVRESRPEPGSVDYQPLRPLPLPDAAKKRKTQAELDATRTDLEAALDKNRRAAAHVSGPDLVAPEGKKKRPAQK
jgi:hypothetical protein